MDYKIEEVNFSARLDELGLTLPDTLAFFPENLDSAKRKEEFVFPESMPDLNKIFRQEHVGISPLGLDTELYRSRKSADIYLPAIFFSLSQITENPTIVSVSLNVLSNYIYDVCKGALSKKTAHVDLYIETKEKGKLKKLCYKGDVDGLKELNKIIKAMK
jgi:hypothetical protein